MPEAHGRTLHNPGADIFIFRKSRTSTTRVLVYVDAQYKGGFIGNVDRDGSPDYVNGKRGPADGHYTLNPKPEADFDGGATEYLPGTPSITGPGFRIGQPGEGWNNTVRFHPCGGSTGCQTGPLEWADAIWDIVARYPNSTHLYIETTNDDVQIPPGPGVKHRRHSWPAFGIRA